MATTMQMSLRSSALAQPLGRKPISSVFRSSAPRAIGRRQAMVVRAGEKESLDSDSYQRIEAPVRDGENDGQGSIRSRQNELDREIVTSAGNN